MSKIDYEKFEKDIQKVVRIAKVMYKNLNSKEDEEKGNTSNESLVPSNCVIDSIIVL